MMQAAGVPAGRAEIAQGNRLVQNRLERIGMGSSGPGTGDAEDLPEYRHRTPAQRGCLLPPLSEPLTVGLLLL